MPFSLFSQTLQEVIDYSIQHNFQIQILEEESKIVEKQAQIEAVWSDPVLKAGLNDIQAVHTLSRNQEAMQNQYVTLSQAIPLNNRLELASDVEKEKLLLFKEKKNILNTNIAFAVREAFIAAQYSKKNLKILEHYITFLKKPLNLLIELSAVERDSVAKFLKTQLLQKSYQFQKQSWQQNIQMAKERIELIGNIEIDEFSDEVLVEDYLSQNLDDLIAQLEMNSPQLKMREVLKKVANKGVALAKANEQTDFTVTGGYYQRFDRNDYVSVSLSFPLYIHKKQANKTVQAMRKSNIENLSYQQLALELRQQLKIEFYQLKQYSQELKILKENSVKIQQLITNAKLSLSGGASLLSYYELFSKKVNNKLSISKKEQTIALSENRVKQLLGVVQ